MIKNCNNCKFLSKLSQLGFRYCLHPNKTDKQGKIRNINHIQVFCPLKINKTI